MSWLDRYASQHSSADSSGHADLQEVYCCMRCRYMIANLEELRMIREYRTPIMMRCVAQPA
jgi:hypothetical protein